MRMSVKLLTAIPRLFLILVIALLISIPSASGQTDNNSEAGILTLGSETQKYYSYLSDEQKRTLKEGLSTEQKIQIFEKLSDSQKQSLFKSLSTDEKRAIYKNLSDTDKRNLFQSLNLMEQKQLFEILDDAEKKIVLDNIAVSERAALLSPRETEVKQDLLGVAPLSNIEKVLSGEFPTDISRNLRQFGYDYFEKGPSSFVPENVVPVGPDYIIGPDDRFTINLWGRAEETYYVTVSRDGRITLPRLGTLDVGGLTYAELKSFLMSKFREYYPDFEMSITMGALRTVDVFIIGESMNPGTYSLSALSTVISALFASGGPSKNGSLRDIRVFSNGNLVKSIDIYDFFIKGTKGNDIRLQQGYTIFIPVLGPVAGIAGHVKRPAIYEMKGSQSIGELIELAGGPLFTSHLQNVVVERIVGHQKRVVNSFDLDPSSENANLNLQIPLQDGDLIKIYPVHQRMEKVVYLQGHVKYPREYELKPGTRLLDIIPSFDHLLPEPYLRQAEILRLMPPDLHPEIVQFDLGKLLSGDKEQNILLQDQDRVTIYGFWEKADKPEVLIKGAVRNPGAYRLYKGMTIKDLIFNAGNVTRTAYLDKADLTRVVPGPRDSETIRMGFSVKRAIEGIPEDNLELKHDDYIYIREIPKYNQALERKVYLSGEFVFPGEYTFEEGERLYSAIERAGGLTDEAYPFGAIFLRESVKRIQRERQLDYISKLEQDILTISAMGSETALDESQVSVLQQTLASKKELVQKLKDAEPTGRMVINVPEILLIPSSDTNVELRPGDRLIIGKKPDSVNIMGEVFNPTALLAEKGKTVGDYLHVVGGPTENADDDQIYIVKVDGSVISRQQGKFGLFSWDNARSRWSMGSFTSIKLDPGDTIIVPRKVITYAWMRTFKDVSQILYQIAITAGVLDRSFL